ncbi:uncharacterized protein LOC111087727 [Limulus polyphemus]|uniref:Uncharacterized protein LOC111087727 n=1 Tax=Limulus polyphemus TaxID=6850 RepID=A0ABM1T5A9_LIMPO|nr:uncharacterized protein LOC111087727 [Limulus polyphemus]
MYEEMRLIASETVDYLIQQAVIEIEDLSIIEPTYLDTTLAEESLFDTYEHPGEPIPGYYDEFLGSTVERSSSEQISFFEESEDLSKYDSEEDNFEELKSVYEQTKTLKSSFDSDLLTQTVGDMIDTAITDAEQDFLKTLPVIGFVTDELVDTAIMDVRKELYENSLETSPITRYVTDEVINTASTNAMKELCQDALEALTVTGFVTDELVDMAVTDARKKLYENNLETSKVTSSVTDEVIKTLIIYPTYKDDNEESPDHSSVLCLKKPSEINQKTLQESYDDSELLHTEYDSKSNLSKHIIQDTNLFCVNKMHQIKSTEQLSSLNISKSLPQTISSTKVCTETEDAGGTHFSTQKTTSSSEPDLHNEQNISTVAKKHSQSTNFKSGGQE